MHAHPELAMKEVKTTAFIKKELEDLGFKPVEIDPTGLMVEINPESKGKTVLLRANIDALPIKESNDFDFKSQNEGGKSRLRSRYPCCHDVKCGKGPYKGQR